MPLGTEVDLGPSHIVFDGDAVETQRSCGHGHPSQLLLTAELL